MLTPVRINAASPSAPATRPAGRGAAGESRRKSAAATARKGGATGCGEAAQVIAQLARDCATRRRSKLLWSMPRHFRPAGRRLPQLRGSPETGGCGSPGEKERTETRRCQIAMALQQRAVFQLIPRATDHSPREGHRPNMGHTRIGDRAAEAEPSGRPARRAARLKDTGCATTDDRGKLEPDKCSTNPFAARLRLKA